MKNTSFPGSWPQASHGVSLATLLIILNPSFDSPILAPAGMGWGGGGVEFVGHRRVVIA